MFAGGLRAAPAAFPHGARPLGSWGPEPPDLAERAAGLAEGTEEALLAVEGSDAAVSRILDEDLVARDGEPDGATEAS